MQENYELVQKGFRVLHPLMAGYIGLEMNRQYHSEWWSEVLIALSDQRDLPETGTYNELIDSLDIANCLRIIDRKWNDVFRDKLSINYRTWAKELMGVRNTVSHIGQQDLDVAYAARALDTMSLLCEGFDKDGADEIREIYQKMRQVQEQSSVRVDGPTPIDVPSENLRHVEIGNDKAINLIELIGTEIVQKTTLTRKVTFAGKTEAYPVYKVRLDALYYNDQNDRISTWITRYRSENGSDALSQLVGEDYNTVIENFIFESNPESIKRTQQNISLVGQREPGVALSDGRIVDGNRRYTCLRRIQRDSKEPIYFETVIMNVDIQKDKKQIKLLELAIQHGEEKKVDYDLIDYAVGTYMDVVKTKLLTIDEYASSTNESIADVKKRIEIAEIISEFLNYLKLPEQFHIARECQVYSLFQEMTAPLRQLSGDEKQKLKTIVFNNVLMRALLDQRKFIRDIKMLIKNETYTMYFDDQEELNERIHQRFDQATISSKADLDRFAQENEAITEELQLSLQRALLRSRKQQLKAKPSESVAKSISLMTDVDSRMFGKLDDSEKKSLKKEMDELAAVVGSFSAMLGNGGDNALQSTSSQTAVPIAEKRELVQVTANIKGYQIALSNPKKAYAVCVSAGQEITRFFVSMRFIGVAMGENESESLECKAFFVDKDNKEISDCRSFTVEAGKEVSINLSLKPDSINVNTVMLVVQDQNGAKDEALQLVPFKVNISSAFKR